MTPAAEARVRAAVDQLVAALVEAAEPAPSAPDRLLSVEEAAELLGLGRTAAYALITGGKVRSLIIGRRRLVPASAIAAFIGDRAA